MFIFTFFYYKTLKSVLKLLSLSLRNNSKHWKEIDSWGESILCSVCLQFLAPERERLNLWIWWFSSKDGIWCVVQCYHHIYTMGIWFSNLIQEWQMSWNNHAFRDILLYRRMLRRTALQYIWRLIEILGNWVGIWVLISQSKCYWSKASAWLCGLCREDNFETLNRKQTNCNVWKTSSFWNRFYITKKCDFWISKAYKLGKKRNTCQLLTKF